MADLLCTLPQRSVYLATTKRLPSEALYNKTQTNIKTRFFGFTQLIGVVYRALSPYYEKPAASVLAYLCLGVSLRVVVEEEGEG